MATIILSVAIMIAAAAALSLKVLLGHQSEVKRFGCGNFAPIDHDRAAGRARANGRARAAGASTCGVCGAPDGEACRDDRVVRDDGVVRNDETAAEPPARPFFSRN